MGKEKVLMICLIFQFLQTKNVVEKYKTPPEIVRITYKNEKRKLEIAFQMSKDSQSLVKRTPVMYCHLEQRLHLKYKIKKSWTIHLVKMRIYKKNLKMLTLKFQN